MKTMEPVPSVPATVTVAPVLGNAPAMVFPQKMNVARKNGIPIPAIGASYALTQKSSPGSVAAPVALARADANKLSGAASARSGNQAARVFTRSPIRRGPTSCNPPLSLLLTRLCVTKIPNHRIALMNGRKPRSPRRPHSRILTRRRPFFRICTVRFCPESTVEL